MGRVEFKANVRAGAFTGFAGNSGNNGWSIDIEDAMSGVHILSLRMTFEQFGALLGIRPQDGIPCEMTAPAVLLGKLGMRRDVTTVVIDWPEVDERARVVSDLNATDAVRGMKAAGWIPLNIDEGDPWNRHHDVPAPKSATGRDGYEVTFVRYVDPASPVPETRSRRMPEPAPSKRRKARGS